ncbi:MAG: hypothetical protein HXY41_01790 [Chloroflexi bacterium]|nr:hypothetical protein [Chloroflexota bacterium]
MKKLAMFGFMLLALAFPARAQQDLTLFTPVSGRIEAGSQQSYRFQAIEGSVLSFVVQATSGDLDPQITLTNSAGAAVIANDDYYSKSHDALIEGITMPRTDMYTVTITGFGSTSGEYNLSMLAGYGQVSASHNFNGETNWQAAAEPLRVEAADGQLGLTLNRPNQIGTALDRGLDVPSVYYARVSVNVTTGQSAWMVGLTARQTGTNAFYLLAINERGQWRFSVRASGADRVVRDWTPHPAIMAGSKTFTLGMLVNGSNFDFFYNDSLIGRLTDTTIPEGGRFGLAVLTDASPNAQMSARFDDLTITRPVLVDGSPVPPSQIILGTPASMAQELQRRNVIPSGGEMALTVGESFIGSARPGVERFMLGRGVSFQNFALGTTFSWQADASGMTGCGLVFATTDDTHYTLAYLDRSGGYGVSQRQGDLFLPGIFGENPLPEKSTYHLLVVVLEDRVLYYVDGVYSGALEMAAAEGGVGNAVVNFEPVNTSCQFRDTWVWRWS